MSDIERAEQERDVARGHEKAANEALSIVGERSREYFKRAEMAEAEYKNALANYEAMKHDRDVYRDSLFEAQEKIKLLEGTSLDSVSFRLEARDNQIKKLEDEIKNLNESVDYFATDARKEYDRAEIAESRSADLDYERQHWISYARQQEAHVRKLEKQVSKLFTDLDEAHMEK